MNNKDNGKVIADAISQAVGKELVTKWVVMAEVIGEEGDRAVWTFCSEDIKSFEILGFAAYLNASVQTQMIKDRLGEE